MITAWNRQEVFATDSKEEWTRVRGVLSMNRLEYAYCVSDRKNRPEYLVYVQNCDYDRARYLICR